MSLSRHVGHNTNNTLTPKSEVALGPFSRYQHSPLVPIGLCHHKLCNVPLGDRDGQFHEPLPTVTGIVTTSTYCDDYLAIDRTAINRMGNFTKT